MESYTMEYTKAARASLEIERDERRRAEDWYEAELTRLRAQVSRLEADLEHAMRGAVAAGATICSLRCLVAELEAALDAAGCDDCRGDCGDCEVK